MRNNFLQKSYKLGVVTGPFFLFVSAAYKHADGKKIDGRRIVVDVERGRTVKTWKPRRLGEFSLCCKNIDMFITCVE